ncbi:MAG: omcB [Streptosporangiaceae bacterium]|nr:omcB [Streptosporangiaceae bacterium]
MIPIARHRLATRSLMVVSVMALFGAFPVLGPGTQARAAGPVVVAGSHPQAADRSATAAKGLRERARPRMSVDINAPSAPVLPGRTYSWPFAVTNTGPDTVEKVIFSAPLSRHLEVAPGEDDCAWRQRTAVCRLGPMRRGETRTGVLMAKVADDACDGDTIGGTAAVTWSGPTAMRRINAAFPPVKVAELPDLSVVEKAPAQVRPGGAVPYEITVVNQGMARAEHVVLRQILHAVLSDADVARPPVTVTEAQSPCASRRAGVVCDLGSLQAGESRKISLNVLVNRDAEPCEIKAPAQVTSSTADVNRANNQVRPVTEVLPPLPVRAAIPARGPGDGARPEHPAAGHQPADRPGDAVVAKRAMGLPHTGAPTRVMVGGALGLVGAGLVLVCLGWRRRRSV